MKRHLLWLPMLALGGCEVLGPCGPFSDCRPLSECAQHPRAGAWSLEDPDCLDGPCLDDATLLIDEDGRMTVVVGTPDEQHELVFD